MSKVTPIEEPRKELTVKSNEDPVTRFELPIGMADVECTMLEMFKTVTSGKEFNREQVKYAIGTSNALAKFARLRFDVYKFSSGRR